MFVLLCPSRVDRLCGDTCPYVCPQTGLNKAQTNIALSQTMGFLNENMTWFFLCISDNCCQVCPKLWVFSRILGSS